MNKLPERIRSLTDSEYHDPFEVLGARSNGNGKVIVRCFIPDGVREVYLIEQKEGVKNEARMQDVEGIGLYEASIEGDIKYFKYLLRIVYTDGSEKVIHDPYSFPPILSEHDIYLLGEGRYFQSYDRLGAHKINLNGVDGISFAVWAPNACRVSVVGDFNLWDGRRHQMRIRGSSGIWEIFIPLLTPGELYKYEIKSNDKKVYIKSDPYGFNFEQYPGTASKVFDITNFKWEDSEWIDKRDSGLKLEDPVTVYEVHLGSWARVPEEDNRSLTYREMAVRLRDYVTDMGYTHIQLMPVSEYPFDGSWGYQVVGYFAPTSRFGTPEDFAWFVNHMHKGNIGVIIDWVPAHFPKDAHGLAYFDGTHLYEHSDPRQGEHQDWGTLIFNFDRNEVKNFLVSSGAFWLEKFHIDGLRVDAVASMLYLDYSRNAGEWVPNEYGGRENLGAVSFIREFNEEVYSRYPGIMMIAEESTAWPAVSRPTYLGGLGFEFKWNMGWMNDTLKYFSIDPVYRKYHQDMLTFSMIYAYHENFILVLSHDEVVHGKRSLLDKMPGDIWQKFANLRLLYCYMYAHPGKKMLFMGGEIGQWEEWDHDDSVKWHLTQYDSHKKLQNLVKDLNGIYTKEPSMYEVDYDHRGFEWIDFEDTSSSVFSFIRMGKDRSDFIICIFNMTPVTRNKYRIGVPDCCEYEEILNSDSEKYWGGNVVNNKVLIAEYTPWQSRECSLCITLPPLGAVYLKPKR